MQESLVARPQACRSVALAGLGDDGQLGVDAATADRRLLVQGGADLVRRVLAVAGPFVAQGALDPFGPVLEVAHGHDADVILVQRGVDRVAQAQEQPHGIASHHHQQDDERSDADEDAVA